MTELGELYEDIQEENFEDVDAQHRLIDKHDKSELGSIVGYVTLISVSFVILKNVDRSLMRSPFFGENFIKEFGEFNLMLILRTFLVEFIFLRLIAWSISTVSTCVLHRKLGKGKVLTRCNSRYQAGIYGFHPYDTIDPKWTLLDPPRYPFIMKYGLLRRCSRWVSERQALFEAYSKELRDELKTLKKNLKDDDYSEINTTKYELKAYEGRKLRLKIDVYNHRLKELKDELANENKTRTEYNKSIENLTFMLKTEKNDRKNHKLKNNEVGNALKSSEQKLDAGELKLDDKEKECTTAQENIEIEKSKRKALDLEKNELAKRKIESEKTLQHTQKTISKEKLEIAKIEEKIKHDKSQTERIKDENEAMIKRGSTVNDNPVLSENTKEIKIIELHLNNMDLKKKSMEENINNLKSKYDREKSAGENLTERLLAIETKDDEAVRSGEVYTAKCKELENEIKMLAAKNVVLKKEIEEENKRRKNIIEEIQSYNDSMKSIKETILKQKENELMQFKELEKEYEQAEAQKAEAEREKEKILKNARCEYECRKNEADKLIKKESAPLWGTFRIPLFNEKTIDDEEELKTNLEDNRNLIELKLIDIDNELANLETEVRTVSSFLDQRRKKKDEIECIKDDLLKHENITSEKAKILYENTSSMKPLQLPEFCREIRNNSHFRKQISESKCTGNLKPIYLWTGNTSSDESLGRKYNRVRRAAGIVLLSEKEAERKLGSRGKMFNGLLALLIIVFILIIRSLVEGSMNVSRIVEQTGKVLFKGPVRGKGSWNCSYIENSKLVLVREEVDNENRNETKNREKCLWEDRLEIISLNREEAEFTIWYDTYTGQWRANETSNIEDNDILNCTEQRVSKSMEDGGLSPGGFLQICGNEDKGEIILIQEKIISTNLGYPKETIIKKNVLKYSSEWITVNSSIASIVAEYVGIRKVMNIDYVLLDLIRLHGVGEISEYRSVTFDTIIEDDIVTSWTPLIISIVLVVGLFLFALMMKWCQLNSFGKINIRADDSSMLSTLYVSRTNLPTSNIVIPRLTPEFEICDTSRGTKYIRNVEESDHKNTFRMLKYILTDESKQWYRFDRLWKESSWFQIQKRIRSYVNLSWEEIQGEETKWDNDYNQYLREQLFIKEPPSDVSREPDPRK